MSARRRRRAAADEEEEKKEVEEEDGSDRVRSGGAVGLGRPRAGAGRLRGAAWRLRSPRGKEGCGRRAAGSRALPELLGCAE